MVNQKKLNSSLTLYLPVFLVSIFYLYNTLGLTEISLSEGVTYKVMALILFSATVRNSKSIGLYFYNQFNHIKKFKNKVIISKRKLRREKESKVVNKFKGLSIYYWKSKNKLNRDYKKLFNLRFKITLYYEDGNISKAI